MMKYRREMTAREHMMVMEDRGEIRVKDNTVIVFTDEDGETSQMVRDYARYWARKGYTVIYR
jgi:dienelactone hydrolase